MSFENFPYTNFHDLNLDWIIKKVKECYSPDNPPESMVISVNGESGIVTLYENAVIQFPTVEENTWAMFRLSNNTETGIQFIKGQKAQRIDSINRYDIYDQGNPPPYPVTNVGGLTGAVAILGTTIVTDGGTQKLQVLFPVSSVDGMTGAVRTWGNNSAKTLKPPVAAEGDAWAISRDIPSGSVGIEFEYDDNSNKTTGYLVFDDGTPPLNKVKLLTLDDIPSSSGVVSINGMTGVVTLTGADINLNGQTTTKVSTAITSNTTAINNKTAKSVITYNSETGGVATHNYSKGEIIQIGNDLYVATANISTGDTFSGSNTTRVTVGEKITSHDNSIASLSDQIATSVSSTQIDGNLKIFKKNGVTIITCLGSISTSISANEWTTIGSVPSGFDKPITDMATSASFGSTGDKTGMARIKTDGTISAYCNQSVSGVWFSIAY